MKKLCVITVQVGISLLSMLVFMGCSSNVGLEEDMIGEEVEVQSNSNQENDIDISTDEN